MAGLLQADQFATHDLKLCCILLPLSVHPHMSAVAAPSAERLLLISDALYSASVPDCWPAHHRVVAHSARATCHAVNAVAAASTPGQLHENLPRPQNTRPAKSQRPASSAALARTARSSRVSTALTCTRVEKHENPESYGRIWQSQSHSSSAASAPTARSSRVNTALTCTWEVHNRIL